MAETTQLALPRPGRGLKALLILYAAAWLVVAVAVNYAHGERLLDLLVLTPSTVAARPWTILTAGLLTDPQGFGHLIFTLIGFYFLSPDLERRWGTGRFLRFIALSIALGFGLSLLLARITPPSLGVFHPPAMFGPSAGLAALAVAWGLENRSSQIRFYFLIPISGMALVWITLGFCALGLVTWRSVTEGAASPFGGFAAGWLLAGSPSPLRRLYLRAKLFLLRRRGPAVHIDLGDRPKAVRKPRPGSPPLRIVQGGMEDELHKRNPPKDKRYLN
jgi:membrane associated rhomboid family serine protease